MAGSALMNGLAAKTRSVLMANSLSPSLKP